MSETPAQAATPTNGPTQTGESTDEDQTFDADYVGKLRQEAAKYRTEARTNASAAKELADLKAATQTEAEKIAARIKSLEDATAAAQVEALRARVAAKHGIQAEDAALLLTGSDEETLTAQAQALVKLKPSGPRSPREGADKQGKPSGDDALRELSARIHNHN